MDEKYYAANPLQKAIIDDFCKKEFEAQVQYLRKRYGLKKYKPQLTCNHNTRAAASYGGELVDGEPYVVLALTSINFRVGDPIDCVYEEYSFLRNKPGIGDGVGNWKKWCAWLIAHELAHTIIAIERFRKCAEKHYPYDIHRDLRDHGKFWQEIYRELRCVFCEGRTYHAEFIDFSDYIFHQTEHRKGDQLLTFYRGQDAVAHFIRSKGVLYKSNARFGSKRKSRYKNVREIKASLVTA